MLADIQSIKRLGEPSTNGFVFEIPFKKHGYTSYTVLKSATSPRSDNLFYEYYVGKTFINKYLQKLPIFVETYDCYMYNSTLLMNTFNDVAKGKITVKDTGITDLDTVITRIDHGDLTSLPEMKKLFEDSCEQPDTICVLIQHFNNLISFKDSLGAPDTSIYKAIEHDVPYLFYQLYFALSVLGNKYTHYDLHHSNVVLYKPYSGQKYILMRYHINGSIYEFPSEYIVKIIDYGRNYINNGTTTTNDIVSNIICSTPKCAPRCGETVGYDIIQGDAHSGIKGKSDFYYINPVTPNASHDLRVFANTREETISNVFHLPRNSIYNIDFHYKDYYGTKEKMGDSSHIRSIHDLRAAIETRSFPLSNEMNKKYFATQSEMLFNRTLPWVKAAVMDIYADGRDYEFTVL
jgi:hypothetical protein